MSEERIEGEQREDETEDVEAHKKKAMTDEPRSEEEGEGDEVEAHRKKV
jgi:hypothetical protein